MKVKIEQISDGIYKHIPTEDVIGYHQRKNTLLAWAIDGASTLTENPFTTFNNISDAGWFGRQISQLLHTQFKDTPFSQEMFGRALPTLQKKYHLAATNATPLWAWPVAAAIIVEIDQRSSQTQISTYRYADCFELVLQNGLPDRTRTVSTPVQPTPTIYDNWKPCSGFQGEALARLRQRRCEQQNNKSSTALTLNPASAMNAIVERKTIHTPAHIVLGSDGLARIWDTYKLMSREQAMHAIVQYGLPALLQRLRDYEFSTLTGGVNLKRRDDACGIHIFLS